MSLMYNKMLLNLNVIYLVDRVDRTTGKKLWSISATVTENSSGQCSWSELEDSITIL